MHMSAIIFLRVACRTYITCRVMYVNKTYSITALAFLEIVARLLSDGFYSTEITEYFLSSG